MLTRLTIVAVARALLTVALIAGICATLSWTLDRDQIIELGVIMEVFRGRRPRRDTRGVVL